jgi:hypothetical protein
MKSKRLLFVSFVLLFFLPYLGSFIRYKGFPPGYGLFPAQKVIGDPGFSLPFFVVGCCIGLFIVLFYVFPRWFGFKKVTPPPTPPATIKEFPKWFWPGLVVTLVSWFFMWARFDASWKIEHYTFVPLWWGFIFVLDGIVYRRNNGVSLMSSRPTTMKLLAIVSSFSWFVFEYLNFFVLENWYYPNDKVFTNFGNITWQIASYTTVLPAIFEWYWLLRTNKKMNVRYTEGPKYGFSKTWHYVALIAGYILMFLMGYFPHQLFFVLWLALIPAIVPTMTLSNLWNPFTPIRTKGDWSFVLLIGLATALNGLFWEFWNFGSEWFHDNAPTNPNYWKYDIPYLDKVHLFSEMPILGYFGYIFFGVVCWVLWLTMAYLTGYNPSIGHKEGIDSEIYETPEKRHDEIL